MRLTPIILIIIALSVFIWYIDPVYKEIKTLSAEKNEYSETLSRSEDLLEIRDSLREKYNQIPPNNLDRIKKMLPDAVDNVRLIIDINNIATKYGLRLGNVDLQSGIEEEGDTDTSVSESSQTYGEVEIGFSVATTYEVFKRFLEDLEGSLRLVDVTGIGFNRTDTGIYNFDLRVKTYWLK